MVSNMKKNINTKIIPLLLLIVLTSFTSIVFASWVVTSSSIFKPEEVPVIKDPELSNYNLVNEFDYDLQHLYPHMGLLDTDFLDKYSFSYFSKDVEGNLSPVAECMNAGTYVARYYNKSSRIYSDYTYVINPIAPIFQLKDSFDKTTRNYYTPTLGPTTDDFTYSGLFGQAISGTISYEKSFPDEGSTTADDLNLQVSCVFKSSNKNYTSARVVVNLPLYPVARIGAKYYSRIETALDQAVSGNEVRIVFTDNGSCNPIIYDDCTIKSGVTLHINYAAESINTSTGTLTGAPKLNLCNTVKLSDNKNLIIENTGKLEIGGQLTGGNGGIECGGTSGNYSQFMMGANSKIISDGIIDCYGYITETSKNNNSLIEANNGEIYLPFVIEDFRGGSATYSIYKQFDSVRCAPFNEINLRNIYPLVTIKYEALVYGYANLYAGDQQNQTTIALISNTSNSLVQLTNQKFSYIDANYDETVDCLLLDIYGGAQTNAMAMNLSIKIIGNVPVSTEKVFFPLSFRQKITLNVAKTLGQNTANYSIGQRYKLLPGASLTVGEDAVLEAYSLEIYKESDYTATAVVGSQPYPSGKGDAHLIVNGELHVGTISGLIESNNSGSFLFINDGVQLNLREPNSISGTSILTSVGFTSVTSYARVNAYQENAAPVETNASVGIYECKSYTYNNNTYYYWNKYSTEDVNSFEINYVTNSEDTTLSKKIVYTLDSTITLNELVLPDGSTVIKKGYTFAGWYLDEELTNEALNKTIASNTITVYADWDVTSYNIIYQFMLGDELADLSSLVEGDSFPKTYTINSTFTGLADLEYEGYDFIGWYYTDGEEIVEISNFNVNYAQDVIFIARFKKAEKPYQINYKLIDSDGNEVETGTLTSELKDLASFNVNNYASSIKEKYGNSDTTISKYFVGYNSTDNTGWYVDKTLNDSLSTLTSENVIDASGDYQVINIYGKLLNKVTVTYEGVTTTYYYIPNSTATAYNAGDNTDANIHVWEDTNNGLFVQYGSTYTIPNKNVTMKKIKFVLVTLSLTNSTATVTSTNGRIIDASYNIMTSLTSGSAYFEYLGSDESTATKITVNPDHTNYDNQNESSTTIKSGDYSVSSTTIDTTVNATIHLTSGYTISVISKGSCITGDTLITLANGNKKMVKDLTATDLLLVFNHETGKYEAMPIIFNDVEPEGIYRIVNLKFSDGTAVKVVYEHGFFDLDENKYVYIREDNMKEFIGHKFYKAEYDGINYIESEVTLIDAYVTEELTTVYSPVTVYHLNYFTEDMLSMPAGIPGLFNIFEFGDNLTYDQEQMQKDIETYGLYTYDDFDEYISYEVYSMFPAPYLKVAVGKGLTTFEDIVDMIYLYLEKHELTK